MALLPKYFYDLTSSDTDGTPRWVDDFVDNAPSIIQPKDLSAEYVRSKNARNEAYSRWLAAFFVKEGNEYNPILSSKLMRFQAIRVLSFKHSEYSDKDWWENYQDAVFRVFVQPETAYYPDGTHKQWYLLCPEDCYLVNRFEVEKTGEQLAPRDRRGRERFLSADRRLRRARLIPVECCHHLRHETTGGILPHVL
jgi:hypothetical protein